MTSEAFAWSLCTAGERLEDGVIRDQDYGGLDISLLRDYLCHPFAPGAVVMTSEAFAWRPIDTAPRDKRVLLSDGDQVEIGQWFEPVHGRKNKRGPRWITHRFDNFLATYWMPLPEPPKNQGQP
jgi:hypothetical protein